ncbi:hypothetical protein PRN20_13110 [Devosia sp. ZB163]|nr:hypothetical protein [Devosia sp. ZB163]MDC9824674.1 hypothetical protein [Devosia sp. ZB163]
MTRSTRKGTRPTENQVRTWENGPTSAPLNSGAVMLAIGAIELLSQLAAGCPEGGPLHGVAADGEGGQRGEAGSACRIQDAALRGRSQAPLIDALLAELGLKGGSLNGLVSSAVAPALDIDEGEVDGVAVSPAAR